MDDPTGISILHPMHMSSRISKVSFMEIWHPTSLFSMETPLENPSDRKIMKFWAKKVFRSLVLKSVVFEIWEPKDHASSHRSQWGEKSLYFGKKLPSPENALFRRGRIMDELPCISVMEMRIFRAKHEKLILQSQDLLLPPMGGSMIFWLSYLDNYWFQKHGPEDIFCSKSHELAIWEVSKGGFHRE